MIAGKTFRKMAGEEALEIFDAAAVQGDSAKLCGVIDDLPEKFFENQVAAGLMHASDIVFSMRPLYRIYWQVQAGGKNLHVAASLALTPDGDPSVWGNGVEKIARMQGCAAVTFSTARRAHVSDALIWGAKVTGVTMKKVL